MRTSENSKEECVADMNTNDDESSGSDSEDESSNGDDQILIEVPRGQDTNSVTSIQHQANLLVIKEACMNHVGEHVMKPIMELKQEKLRRIQPGKPAKKLLVSPTVQQQLLGDNKKGGSSVGRITYHMMKKLSKNCSLAIRKASAQTADYR